MAAKLSILQEHRGLDCADRDRCCRLENRPQVLQNLVRLLGDATFDQVAGRRIERDPAGANTMPLATMACE